MKTKSIIKVALVISLLLPTAALAKVDLVTLPEQERVQLTIYNSADLTLARDMRKLTMREGENRLQFSWAGTLIDPTSLELLPRALDRDILVNDLLYPARVGGVGVWNVAASAAGPVPVEISYFTSGISWRAFYMATLSQDEASMELEGYVLVNNSSGEDYPNAETRLIVGKINLLDRVAELARRGDAPYGRPIGSRPMPQIQYEMENDEVAAPRAVAKMMMGRAAPKEIVKEGLSEYFLYTIEGTEEINDGWGKRLTSFSAESVPVESLYRYEPERYGEGVIRFISFANDTAHKLGGEPIPGGAVMVFRESGDDGALTFVGARETKYIPKEGEVNLNLGVTRDVRVKVTEMSSAKDGYEWNTYKQTGRKYIEGHMDVLSYKVEVENLRGQESTVEVRRNLGWNFWDVASAGDYGKYEKVDADTIQYTLNMAPGEKKTFEYTARLRRGTLAK